MRSNSGSLSHLTVMSDTEVSVIFALSDPDLTHTHWHKAQPVAQQFVLEWIHLSYAIKAKRILSDISGKVVSGEMLAGERHTRER